MLLLILFCVLALLALFLLAPGRASRAKKAPFAGKFFAHRGLHAPDKTVPENSLRAFRRAAEAGWGVELDVRLAADGEVVVFHDDTLDRVCGVPGRVSGFTYEELQAFPLCGTDQTIPRFADVLDALGDRVPVIVELKTGPRSRELCEKTCALMRARRGDLCMESFDPVIVAWFRFHGREFLRGQLATARADYRADGRSPLLAALLSGAWLNFLGRPQFIAYSLVPKPWSVRLAERLGAMKMGWVVRSPADEAGLDGVIFEFYSPSAEK